MHIVDTIATGISLIDAIEELNQPLNSIEAKPLGDSITQLMFESDTHMWASQLVHQDISDQQEAVTVAYIRSDYLLKLDDFSLIKPNEGEGYQIGVGSNFPWVHAIPRFKYIMINTI
ncbi:uncharacterized protein B0P05DRAFT_374764 [Gilbertella persicaria]|uniref:uncharacterized protein n=1 Tax=Gilbertella persicaria TaxID=101096 RepID=UPI00221F8FE9|nr:uncharacterized protein B0P05DRAFT_374764 [Gilbertella persicaria]KAI8087802.1 hypothetical protein B0P05DRAFT_374764 [Gilbertella persicaria]